MHIANKQKDSIIVHKSKGDTDFVLKETMDIIENSEPDMEFESFKEESKSVSVSIFI